MTGAAIDAARCCYVATRAAAAMMPLFMPLPACCLRAAERADTALLRYYCRALCWRRYGVTGYC